ncbi:MAG: GTP cyclohydrolase, FolE2/MptA family [Desulfobulbaceae bacterium]|nr:GTP cyclohydrolase, FolE2/MptA family [Desulfobulbaceae bacterium]
MKDIQSQPDSRRINIKKVGVKDISYPITVLDKARTVQRTVGRFNMYVNLPHQFKGTHMSRFVEILNRFHGDINLKSFHLILEEMKTRLQAEEAHMEIEFPFFLKRQNCDPSMAGSNEYTCKMHGSLDKADDLILTIQVPISAPLPLQSAEGLPKSLGQWGVAEVALRFRHFIWIEDLVAMVENVTCHDLAWQDMDGGAGEDSLAVEEMTKRLGGKIAQHPHIRWFSVTVENFARGYSTFATIEWPEAGSPPSLWPTENVRADN